MSDNQPLVSVVIPVFNAAGVIRRTLDSVKAQIHKAIEVLVVDDGSSDESAAIVEAFAAQDHRFRLLRQVNSGVGAARNTAIRHARGKYIAPLDADDLWMPEKLTRQVERLERGGEKVGMVYCWSFHIDEHDHTISSQSPIFLEGQIRRALVFRNFLGNASVPLFRADALKQVGGYLTRSQQGGAQGCEDWDLHLRMAERFETRVAPEYLVGYRQTASAMSVAARGMARSFVVTLHRARQRNPDLPDRIFHWAGGHFYSYLSRKCYRWHDFSGCLRYAWLAVSTDPLVFLDTSLQSRAAKSTVRLLTGTRPRSQPSPSLNGSEPRTSRSGAPVVKRTILRNKLYSFIHARRWATVQRNSAH